MVKTLILCDFFPDSPWTFRECLSEELGEVCEVKRLRLNHLHSSSVKSALRVFMYVFAPLFWLRCNRKYSRILAWQQFFGVSLAFWLRLFHCRKRASIVVMTFIYKPKTGLAGKLYRWFVRYALGGGYVDRVIVFSRTEPEYYARVLDLPVDMFHFMEYAIDELPLVEARESGSFIFSTGRSNRDWTTLFEAVRGTDRELVVACDNAPDPRLDNVRVLRSVFGEEMLSYMSGSRCVAVSLDDSEISSGQLVFLQAMQLGKPIVCTDCPPVRDYLVDGRNAILVSSVEGWREAFARIFSDGELCRRLGDMARQDYSEYFSIPGLARRVAGVLKEV